MLPGPRPISIEGTPGSRIRLLLGETGLDFVLVVHEEDRNSKWQSQYWDTANLVGIPRPILRQISNCDMKGRNVSQMTIDPENLVYFIRGDKRDGSGSHHWWSGNLFKSELHNANKDPVKVSFGDDGRYVVIYGSNGYRSYNCNSNLVSRMKRIRDKNGTINFVKLLPNSGYFISDSDSSQWVCQNMHVSRLLKNNRQGPVLDVVVAQDGSWVIIRPNCFQLSTGVSSELKQNLNNFYSRQRARKQAVDRDISAYDFAVALERREAQQRLEQRLREEAENRRAEEERRARELALAKERRVQEEERLAREKEDRARKTRDENIRVMQIQRRRIKLGDRVTAIEHSTTEGDVVVRKCDKNGVVVCRDNEQFTITDPRLVTSVHSSSWSSSSAFESKRFILLMRAHDEYEAAVSLLQCECHDGVCACTRIARGEITAENYRNGDPGSASSSGRAVGERVMQVSEEVQFSVAPVLEHRGEIAKFDDYKCAEKIDLRRLKRIVDDLRKDDAGRKCYMNKLREQIEDDIAMLRPGEWALPTIPCMKEALSIMERCHSLQATAEALYELLKDHPTDKKGCVVYEVTYEHRDPACRGRLFACGKTVDTGLDGKFPRTATLQGMHSDLRAPLVGEFAHDIDCENSDIRLLCSLADQLDLKHLIPSLLEYRDCRASWLQRIMNAHDVSEKTAKRLSTIVVSGGRYATWLKNARTLGVPLEPRSEIDQFVFKLTSQLAALRDELVAHPRFQWVAIDREKLRRDGKSDASIDLAILARIVFHCETEVLSLLHRSFHQQGWTVRAKVFDGLIVEEDTARPSTGSVYVAMRKAEAACGERGWDIRLDEKPLFGKENEDMETVTSAREHMKNRVLL